MKYMGHTIAMLLTWGTVLWAVFVAPITPAGAHEMRSALLDLREEVNGDLSVDWRVGANVTSPLKVEISPSCAVAKLPALSEQNHIRRHTWSWTCSGGPVAGRTVSVVGLKDSGVDVVGRFEDRSGVLHQRVLTASEPWWRLGTVEDKPSVWSYLWIGVEHIILGPDHLLFVLGLVLLVGMRWRTLLGVVTSFTLGHSVTLALASLGWVQYPTRAVEAIIALSVLLLAWEASHPLERQKESLAWRRPWIFALVCGLLHGLGFAGALSEIGLPADAVLGALLLFNLGVEAGQLAFVGVMALVISQSGHLTEATNQRVRMAALYAMGIISSFWLIERVVSIFDAG